MGNATIMDMAPADRIAPLADFSDDDGTRRSIGRQVIGVIIAAVLLAAVFLSATAHAVISIDQASTTADRMRAEAAVASTFGHGRGVSNTAIREIGQTFQLAGARLTRPDKVTDAEFSIPLHAMGDMVMAWTPRRLGTETFINIAPIRITLAMTLIVAIGLVLQRLHALAQHIDRRRVAARSLAGLDPLTGLSNRLDFNEKLASRVGEAANGSARAALLLLDLDGFKDVNDRYGHIVGDRLLQELAKRLRTLAAADDVVARLGGDEFAVIRQSGLSRAELAEFARDLVRVISTPCVIEGQNISVSVSVGIAEIDGGSPDTESLIRAADSALYGAKARWGGSHEFAANITAFPRQQSAA